MGLRGFQTFLRQRLKRAACLLKSGLVRSPIRQALADNASRQGVGAHGVIDAQGNAVAAETLVNENFFQFSHNVPVTDIMNVSALLTNDSAGVACLIEDQLYWEMVEVIPGSYYGTWAFVHDNVGVDVTGTLGIDDYTPAAILDNKMYDLLGRELQVAPIGQMYIQNKRKYIQFH